MESGGSGEDRRGPDGTDRDPPDDDPGGGSGDPDDERFPPEGEDGPVAPTDGNGDDGWRFSLDDVDDDGIVRPTIEPGNPDVENALFVLLGAIVTVLVFVRLWMLVG